LNEAEVDESQKPNVLSFELLQQNLISLLTTDVYHSYQKNNRSFFLSPPLNTILSYSHQAFYLTPSWGSRSPGCFTAFVKVMMLPLVGLVRMVPYRFQ
jgi:hypothetical protein